MPAARRVLYACQLTGQPRLMEPIYQTQIQTTIEHVGTIYSCIGQKRGIIFSEEQIPGTPQVLMKAYLPVAESFGFTDFLRSQTSGQAFPQNVFDHWEIVSSDPLEMGSKSNQIMSQIRGRKGMNGSIPNANDYMDKL